MQRLKRRLLALLICSFPGLILCFGQANAQNPKPQKPVSPLSFVDGKLVYAADKQGNRIPDFSYAGYMAANSTIPFVQVKVVVPPGEGDATLRIQSALDFVASLPVGKEGLRGAVLLGKGVFNVEGELRINASGVILRGSGMGEDGTILLATGKNRETLIHISGKKDIDIGTAVHITDPYVPVNSVSLHVNGNQALKPGSRIFVMRPSTVKWIDTLGTGNFGGGITYLGWKPGDRDLVWDREIKAVNGNEITLDVPLTTALDSASGGGTISVYQWPGRICNCGVENLLCRSAYNLSNPKDEEHSWMAIVIENAMDTWVRQVAFEHFAGSAVALLETARRVTVEDCKSSAPVSEIGGQRRYTFFTMGQQTLFQRCYAENGYHDFAVGFCAAGPNAFVQCESNLPFSFSGTIDSWASGVLFDVVTVNRQALSYLNRGQDNNGAGWTAANSVFWQCSASRIDCPAPPTAMNWAFGSWSQFSGNGYWESSNEYIQPRSLYYAQLAERSGAAVLNRAFLLKVETEASSSPRVEEAAALTAQSVKPHMQLTEWIDKAPERQAIPVSSTGIKTIDEIGVTPATSKKPSNSVQILNGWIVYGKTVMTGQHHEEPWWRGTLQPDDLKASKPAITRFVPGRTGLGLTDDLNGMADWMLQNHVVSTEHNYGLWYDRRRDDHERIQRLDGEVWPPFYEQPFARSGQGIAWDGLSKYDLTKYNTWYWSRLKQFADLADQKGLVLVHQNYFQHNIIEAGAHYADFPWRTANNINNTGFPEPPPFAGDKRIFMAEQYYDITNPTRRELYRAYIRKCLDNFRDNHSVIQLTGAEFTGPLHFVQFWIDVVKEWEMENGKKAVIGLSATKDVQDAILSDVSRAGIVDVIDIRFWHYQADGSAYAPAGGQSLAPRQQARLFKPKKSSFDQVYRAVSEYRMKYPGKAVTYSSDSYDNLGWAAFMAGGSLANLPAAVDPEFLKAASSMLPVETQGISRHQYKLASADDSFIIYNDTDQALSIGMKDLKGSYNLRWIDPKTGNLIQKTETVKAEKLIQMAPPVKGPVILWAKHS